MLPRAVLASGLKLSIGGLIATSWPGDAASIAEFFGIYGLAAAMLLVGFGTRTATVICWLCALGLLARNPLVLHRADTLVKMLLFWSMFLPLGRRWSIDRLLSKFRSDGSSAIASPASAALLLQPCLMFWFAVLSRSPVEWWREGSALYYASHCDVIVRPLGAWLKTLPPEVLATMTRAVIVTEAALPLALWSPWATTRVRPIAVGLLLAMAAAFGLSFHIGYFPLMCMISVLPFLPASLWERSRAAILHARTARSPTWATAVAAGFLLYSVAMNLDAHATGISLHRAVRSTGSFLGLDQRWDIFAPAPPKEDEWFVVVGQLRDGSAIDLLHERDDPSVAKPDDFGRYFKDYRWRRYWFSLRNFPTLAGHYVAYAARDWDARHTGVERLESVRIDLVRERTPAFGTPQAARPLLERETVWPPADAATPAARGAKLAG